MILIAYLLSVFFAPYQYVHFTFDDGPRVGRTDRVLDVLKKHNVKATFFVVGARLREKGAPALLLRIYNEGHTVGIHGYDHISMNKLSFNNQKREITRSIKAIKKILPTWQPTVYRPPNGVRSKAIEKYLLWRGIKTVMWDIDSRDVTFHARDDIVDVVWHLMVQIYLEYRSGNILMHNIYKFTSVILDRLMGHIKEYNDYNCRVPFPKCINIR